VFVRSLTFLRVAPVWPHFLRSSGVEALEEGDGGRILVAEKVAVVPVTHLHARPISRAS
jgi:hypothetical protein